MIFFFVQSDGNSDRRDVAWGVVSARLQAHVPQVEEEHPGRQVRRQEGKGPARRRWTQPPRGKLITTY